MYTKKAFGQELKDRVLKRECVAEIGHWSYSIYLENVGDIESDFEDILLALNTMELGSEFEFTYEELNQIADDLIAGKPVNL